MLKYADIDHDSGVEAYEPQDHGILVMFKDGSVYEYTDRSAGPRNILHMKQLAAAGDGLNAFINRYVKKGYSRKLR